jgi:hypothetical protein
MQKIKAYSIVIKGHIGMCIHEIIERKNWIIVTMACNLVAVIEELIIIKSNMIG